MRPRSARPRGRRARPARGAREARRGARARSPWLRSRRSARRHRVLNLGPGLARTRKAELVGRPDALAVRAEPALPDDRRPSGRARGGAVRRPRRAHARGACRSGGRTRSRRLPTPARPDVFEVAVTRVEEGPTSEALHALRRAAWSRSRPCAARSCGPHDDRAQPGALRRRRDGARADSRDADRGRAPRGRTAARPALRLPHAGRRALGRRDRGLGALVQALPGARDALPAPAGVGGAVGLRAAARGRARRSLARRPRLRLRPQRHGRRRARAARARRGDCRGPRCATRPTTEGRRAAGSPAR